MAAKTSQRKLSVDPMGFVEILRNYCVEELGSVYFYLPSPMSDADQEAWAWLEAMRMVRAVRAGPYRLQLSDKLLYLQRTHPILFSSNPTHFDVYRLDRDRFPTLLDALAKNPC